MRFLAIFLLVLTLKAENIVQIDGASLLKISECKFKLITSLDIDFFGLSNPNRFVLDIIGARIKKNENIVIKDECLTGIRIGSHPKFIRIVFDLKNKVSGEFKDGLIILSAIDDLTPTIFNPSPTTSPTIPSVPTISEPTPSSTLTQSISTPIVISSPTTVPTPPVSTPTLTTSSIPTNLSNKKVLTRIEFLAHGARVTFSSEISFKQSKVETSVFKITIPGASLGSDKVKHPFFAPQDIPGIISIVPLESADGVTLEITVERNTQVFAYRDGNYLEIRKG